MRRAAEIALRAEGRVDREITIVLVTDRPIARLNERYLGHAGPTDVLAFGAGHRMPRLPGARRWLGDIVISVEMAKRQASRWRRTVAEELAEYVIHGVLHLAGYDDAAPTAQRRMHRRQAALFNAWRSAKSTRSS